MTAAQRGLRLALWIQSELVVIMTDLGELVGGPYALYLLFGIPMVWAASWRSSGSWCWDCGSEGTKGSARCCSRSSD